MSETLCRQILLSTIACTNPWLDKEESSCKTEFKLVCKVTLHLSRFSLPDHSPNKNTWQHVEALSCIVKHQIPCRDDYHQTNDCALLQEFEHVCTYYWEWAACKTGRLWEMSMYAMYSGRESQRLTRCSRARNVDSCLDIDGVRWQTLTRFCAWAGIQSTSLFRFLRSTISVRWTAISVLYKWRGH